MEPHVCRACLKQEASYSLFTNHDEMSVQFSHMLDYCASVQVDMDDGLPSQICEQCADTLVNFYKFKKIVSENDMKLRQQLLTTEVQIKIEVDADEIPYQSCDFDLSLVKTNDPDLPNISTKTKWTKRMHQCNLCGEILSCRTNWEKHMRVFHVEEKPYACDICGKKLTTFRRVAIHKRIHSGEKPYECSICQQKFTHYATLVSHRRTHTGEKPYICSTCGKAFGQLSSFAYHKRTHTGERPYKCEVCGKGFRHSGNRQHHMRFHNNDRRYKCEFCEMKFIMRSTLLSHIKKHTGEKPHKCNICGKAFVKLFTLKVHFRTHSGERPYACEVCSSRFTQKSTLDRHMRVHGGP